MFLGVVVGLVFFGGVLPRFLLYKLGSRSRKCQVFCFWFRSLFLVFSVVVVVVVVVLFLFFQEIQLRANRTHPTLRSLVLFFSFFVPAALGLSPVLAVRPFFLAFCRDAILGPGCFGDFWILSEHWGA